MPRVGPGASSFLREGAGDAPPADKRDKQLSATSHQLLCSEAAHFGLMLLLIEQAS